MTVPVYARTNRGGKGITDRAEAMDRGGPGWRRVNRAAKRCPSRKSYDEKRPRRSALVCHLKVTILPYGVLNQRGLRVIVARCTGVGNGGW